MGNLKFNFSGKRVLITGAGQGIGLQIAKDFIDSSAQVIIWEKSSENIAKLKKDLPKKQLSLHQVDISFLEDCEKEVQSLTKPIDFLINNAGILRDRTFSKMNKKEYSSVIQTNLNGVFFVTKSLLNHFNPNSFKRIVNLSSVVALYGNFGQSNYVAAKAGVIGLTKVWAKELGKKGWTVNALAPGFIETDILKNMPQETIENLIKKIPVKRMGVVKDISQACLFLCSQEAGYINGSVLEITGGFISF
ncbi:MAG: SDR family oxidoreductase [Bdellovibrionales bacterium]|nr:SDR family oxidoreductase [Bdellovibrionales bacterium]